MKRNLSIESLRGLAAILMVAGHVVGSDATRGMGVVDDSGWRLFYLLLEDVRMPLFSALSGFVYAYRPVADSGGYGKMVVGKVRRLLVPLVTVGTLFILMQNLVPGANAAGGAGDFVRLYVYGAGHFWFLQSIFLVFLVVGVLDLTGVLRSARGWGIATGVALALAAVVDIPAVFDVFSIQGAVDLLPFFLLGYGAHRWLSDPPATRWVIVALVVFAATYSLRILNIADVIPVFGPFAGLERVLVGFSAVALLLLLRDRLRLAPLVWLGPFAFAVYLLHVFGSAAARLALQRLGVENEFVVFGVGMVFALAVPIAFEMTFGRIAWISWAILGQKPYRGRRSAAATLGVGNDASAAPAAPIAVASPDAPPSPVPGVRSSS